MNLHFSRMPTPIGPLLLVASDAGLVRIEFEHEREHPDPEGRESPSKLRAAIRQLDAYFQGKRRQFKLDLAPEGTEFQLAVWEQLQRIPYGETISYGELARRVGNPNASRAVGAANGRNPLPVVIPCHRVVGSDGTLTGFGGGLPIKQALLELEGALPAQRELFGS